RAARESSVEAEEAVTAATTEASMIVSKAGAEARQIVEGSQAEADERFRKLEEELAVLRAQAETRRRELEADTNAVWQRGEERRGGMGAIASALLELADPAAERLPLPPTPQVMNVDAGGESEPRTVATDDTAHLMPAIGSPHATSESNGERAEPETSSPDKRRARTGRGSSARSQNPRRAGPTRGLGLTEAGRTPPTFDQRTQAERARMPRTVEACHRTPPRAVGTASRFRLPQIARREPPRARSRGWVVRLLGSR